MLPAASDNTVLRLNMALPPLIIFGIGFQSNRDIPRCRQLLPYYWQRSLCQAVKTAVHEVPGAGDGGIEHQGRTAQSLYCALSAALRNPHGQHQAGVISGARLVFVGNFLDQLNDGPLQTIMINSRECL